MKAIKIYVFLAVFIVENIVLFFLYFGNHVNINFSKDISGVYKLSTLQAQNSQEFKPMEGVEILKIFSSGLWISPAYDKQTKKVVSLSGGRYLFDPQQNSVIEEVLFNMKDANSIGLKTPYKLYLNDEGFYQSGIYKAGTQDAWKVEEKWIKENY